MVTIIYIYYKLEEDKKPGWGEGREVVGPKIVAFGCFFTFAAGAPTLKTIIRYMLKCKNDY